MTINEFRKMKNDGVNINDIVWAFCRSESVSEKAKRLFAADCAERVLYFFEANNPDESRPRAAVEAARKFALGEISFEELQEIAIAVHSFIYENDNEAQEIYNSIIYNPETDIDPEAYDPEFDTTPKQAHDAAYGYHFKIRDKVIVAASSCTCIEFDQYSTTISECVFNAAHCACDVIACYLSNGTSFVYEISKHESEWQVRRIIELTEASQ